MEGHTPISEVEDPPQDQSLSGSMVELMSLFSAGMEAIYTKIAENITACRPVQYTTTKFVNFDPDEPESDIKNWCMLTEMIIKKKKIEGRAAIVSKIPINTMCEYEPKADVFHLNASVQNQSGTVPDDDLNDVDIEDMEYIFDTPKQSSLRSQIHRKIKFIYKYKRKINLLHQKNIEITQENKQLKEEIIKCIKNGLVVCLDLPKD